MNLTTPLALSASLNLSRSFVARSKTVDDGWSCGCLEFDPTSGGDTVCIVTWVESSVFSRRVNVIWWILVNGIRKLSY